MMFSYEINIDTRLYELHVLVSLLNADFLHAAVNNQIVKNYPGDEQGREIVSASLGRSYYFRDRLVTLPGDSQETSAASDWAAGVNSQWTNTWSSHAALLWNTQSDEVSQGTFETRYVEQRNQALHLGYRYKREDNQKQVDVAAIWPLAAQWNVVGRWLRSLHDSVTLESIAGIEYESCCWNLSVVHRRYRENVDATEVSDSIWLQLELKGLTSIGRGIDDLVAHDILAP